MMRHRSLGWLVLVLGAIATVVVGQQMGDVDGDGFVDGTDLLLLQTNWHEGTPRPTPTFTATIPSPSETPTSPSVGPTSTPTPTSTTGASAGHWERAGFSAGGLFLDIVVDPVQTNVLYTGSDVAGMYKSEDYGDSWRPITGDLPPKRVVDLEYRDGYLYAATGCANVYRIALTGP